MIRVGASGWSHPAWVGPFYPVSMREDPEAWFGYYARRFRTVEITSTFDAFPDEQLVDTWAREGVALLDQGVAFDYSLKLPRAVTHAALPGGDVGVAREITGRFDREVLDPLAGEGLLGAVLLQLPPGFGPSSAHVAALHEVVSALAERRVAIELRDARWYERGCLVPPAERLFSSPWVALAEVDAPFAPTALAPVAARHAYLRLHGRRHDVWADARPHDGARYDYLYREDELRPIAERAALLAASQKDVRVYFRNTPGAKAIANAAGLLAMVGDGARVARPRLTAQTRLDA